MKKHKRHHQRFLIKSVGKETGRIKSISFETLRGNYSTYVPEGFMFGVIDTNEDDYTKFDNESDRNEYQVIQIVQKIGYA